MKLKLDKRRQSQISKIKAIIETNRVDEEHLIDTLAAEMNLNEDQKEILWDHIYNDSEWTVEKE
jgi:hypothetical protein